MFQFVLDVAEAKGLRKGKTVAAESDKHIQEAVLDKGCCKHPNLDTFTTFPLASRNAPFRQFGRPKVTCSTGC